MILKLLKVKVMFDIARLGGFKRHIIYKIFHNSKKKKVLERVSWSEMYQHM